MTFDEAYEKMYERNYFGMMMVETGEADALITGVYTKYADTIQAAKDVIGLRKGLKYMAAMHIMNTKKGTFFLADTLFNRHPTTETLIDIAKAIDTMIFFILIFPPDLMLLFVFLKLSAESRLQLSVSRRFEYYSC